MADVQNNTLNTRIQLKYDTYSNWTTNDPVLLAGEIAIATIASGSTQEVNSVAVPQVLIKVGDGTKKYSELNFISAKAADVYAWAKKSGIEITKSGTGNVVASISWDSENNKIVYTTESVATAEGMQALSDALSALTEKVNAMYTNEQIDTKVADAKKAGTDAQSDLNTFKDTVSSTYATKDELIEVDQIADEALALGKVAATQTALNALDDRVGDIEDDYLTSADKTELTNNKFGHVVYDSANKKINFYANSSSSTVLGTINAADFVKDGMVSNVEYDDTTTTLTITFNTDAGKEVIDVDLSGLVETYTAGNGLTASGTTFNVGAGNGIKVTADTVAVKIDSTSEDFLTVSTNGIKLLGVQDAIDTKASQSDFNTLSQTVAQDRADLEKAISDGDNTAIAQAEENTIATLTENQAILDGFFDISDFTTISEIQAEFDKKANSADLAAIATSGDIKDLKQTTGTYVVFNCGTSSTVI